MRHQVHAGDPLRRRLAGSPQRPDHRHAVGHDEIAGPAGLRQLRISAHHAQVRGVDRDDRVGGTWGAAQLKAPVHRSVHGHRIDRKAEEVCLLGGAGGIRVVSEPATTGQAPLTDLRLCLLGFGSVAREFCELLDAQERACEGLGLRVLISGVGTRHGSLLVEDGMTPAAVLASIGEGPAPPQAARPAPDLLAASGADVLVELTVMEEDFAAHRDEPCGDRLQARPGCRHGQQGAHRLELAAHR